MMLLLFFCHLAFCTKRSLRYLRSVQQEDYLAGRYIRWWWKGRAWDKRGSLSALAGVVHPIFAVLGLAFTAWREVDPRTHGKIHLRMTPRAVRIARVNVALIISLSLPLFFLPLPWLSLPVFYQLLPLLLPLSLQLLDPDEGRRQHEFREEAVVRLRQVDPLIIGITGSFGKTSTKNVLGELLNVTLGPTFWPRAGVNTEMGIIREVRERLRPGTELAVIEMGAYGIGSIENLCKLTPPRAGIITAVGFCHLERFKSRGAIAKAKSELAKAIPSDGILVVNGDDDEARKIAHAYPKKTTILFGSKDPDLDCRLIDYQLTPQGTSFTLNFRGASYSGFVPLWGRPALFNVLAAFCMGVALGAQPEYLIAAIRNLQPVRNRLHIESIGGITRLHDAYNSNPVGFRAALDVLQELPAERRILMTPGMIELGAEQSKENRSVARAAGKVCDRVIVVGSTNHDALVAGLREAGLNGKQIIEVPDRDQALRILGEMQQEGDAILIENDLPDLYESQGRF